MKMDNQTLITEKFCVPLTSTLCGDHGLCNAEGTFCTCEPGYLHDYTQFMFPNCYMSRRGLTAILCVVSGINLLIFVAALFVIRGTKGMPRIICQLVLLSSMFEWAHIISLALERKPGIASEFFLVLLNTIGGCMLPFVFLWTLVSPALELMMLQNKLRVLKFRIRVFMLLFFLENAVVYGVAVGYQYAGDYKKFNTILASQYFFMTFYCAYLFLALRYYSQLLFVQMDRLIDSMSDSKKKSHRHSKDMGESNAPKELDKIVRHRRKLGSAVARTFPLLVIGSLFCALFAVSYFGFKVHPYRFVLFFTFMLAYPCFYVILLVFVYQKQNYSSSNDGSNTNQSNKLTAPANGTGSQGQHGTLANVKFSSNHSDIASHHQQAQSSMVVPATSEAQN